MVQYDKDRETEMRAGNMVDEGGLGVEAHYKDHNYKHHKRSEERIAAKAMVDEGGLGAEIYYNEEEKIAIIDVEQNEDDYVN